MNTEYKTIIVGVLACILLGVCSCTQKQSDRIYIVEGDVSDSTFNGRTIYIMRYDDHQFIDTTVIQNNRFVFEGIVDTASYCRIDFSHDKFASFILEPGNIKINPNGMNEDVYGTPMNEEMNLISDAQDSIYTILKQKMKEFGIAFPEDAYQSEEYVKYRKEVHDKIIIAKCREFIKNHTNDAIGYYLMYRRFIHDLPVDEKLDILHGLGPWLKSTRAVKDITEMAEYEKQSQVGMPFVDIKGVDDKGKSVSISDYLGKGNYVLVDLWASWCMPCKWEIPNLAKVHNLYKNKGLTLVGVFTWDKPENLVKAMKEDNVEWNQIIDTERTAMKKYGVQGIPFIFLLSPDGTILERNLRGNNILSVVEKYLNKTGEEESE